VFKHILSRIGLNRTKKICETLRPTFKSPKRLRHEPLEDRRMLATLTVNVDWDGGITEDGNLLLREAIAYVNGVTPQPLEFAQINESVDLLGVNDKIVFSTAPADGLNVVGGATILLTQGELSITESVTIDATALKNGLTVDAGNGFNGIAGDGDGTSVFAIEHANCDTECTPKSNDVTLAGLTITGGDTASNGGGIRTFGFTNEPEKFSLALTIRDSTITGNYALAA